LLPGEAGDLAQVTPDDALVGPFQLAVAQTPERVGDKGIRFLPLRDFKFERLAALQDWQS
jgi:hypothetical protein